MSDSDEKIVYVRLPEETLMQLDIECARRRIKRPGGIALAVDSWLRGTSDLSASSGTNPPTNKTPDSGIVSSIEKIQWADILRVLQRIEERLNVVESKHGRSSDDQDTAPGVEKAAEKALKSGRAAREEYRGTFSGASAHKKRAG